MSARANARATSLLPTPGGPWKRYACAGPSRSAASRRRAASGCSEKRANVLTNLLRNLLGGTCTVDRDDPVWLRRGQRAVPRVDLLHELRSLALDPVMIAGCPAERLVGIEQHEKRP